MLCGRNDCSHVSGLVLTVRFKMQGAAADGCSNRLAPEESSAAEETATKSCDISGPQIGFQTSYKPHSIWDPESPEPPLSVTTSHTLQIGEKY